MACKDKAMLRWCDAVNKYSFIIQHRSGAKHRNADALSWVRLTRVLLTQCNGTECPECKVTCNAFAAEDESVLPWSEELLVKPVDAKRRLRHDRVATTCSRQYTNS